MAGSDYRIIWFPIRMCVSGIRTSGVGAYAFRFTSFTISSGPGEQPTLMENSAKSQNVWTDFKGNKQCEKPVFLRYF